jgi:hypothetical protein
MEEQVGQWIAAQADAVTEELPKPSEIREAHLPPAAEPAGQTVGQAVELAPGEVSVYGGMATGGVPRCPHCHHPVGHRQDTCPYCGMSLRADDEKAGRRLARAARKAHRIRRERVGEGPVFAGSLVTGWASAALMGLVVASAAGVGSLAFFFPWRDQPPHGIHGEWLSAIALGVIGLGGGLVSLRVSIRGRPRMMTPFVLLVVAGWVYQATTTAQMLWGWDQIYPHLKAVNRGWGWAYASTLLVTGGAALMILQMRRMGLAVLAVAVLAGLVLLHVMRGMAGGAGHVPPFAYCNAVRTLIAVAGLLKFADLMNA